MNAPRIEVLHVTDCPNLAPMLDRLGQATDLPVITRIVDTDADATRLGMAGSPTLMVDGVDPFAVAADGCVCSLSCRLYRDEAGRVVPAPTVEQLRSAVQDLGEWRAGAVPLDPAEQAAHRAILRSFATTGRAPTEAELGPVGGERGVPDLLRALHLIDAIRLAPDGRIAVAYPFSATPTRHRVRILAAGDGPEVYAMCAIDALGIAPMLDRDTLIESTDLTAGRPVSVTTTAGRSRWEPASAVVFVGAECAGRPSADCCCDHLNFYTDHRSAQTWSAAHRRIPGRILGQAEAEALAGRLFGRLLTD